MSVGVVLIRLLGSFGCVCLLTIKFPNRLHSESVIFIRNIFEHIFKNVYFFLFFRRADFQLFGILKQYIFTYLVIKMYGNK